MDANADNRSAQVIQIDNSKHLVVVAICAALCAVAASFAAFSFYVSTTTATEARLTQYYLLELDAHVTQAGIQQPDESVAAKLGKKR